MSEESKLPLDAEQERLTALSNYEVMDTAADPDFDNLTRLASQIFKVPIAFISFVDEKRQWFKSIVGLDLEHTPRGESFCQFTILQQAVLEIPDTTQDAYFKNHPMVVGPPYLRYYAGAPLIDKEGFNLGSLCIMDFVPRSLTVEEKNILETLAREVILHLTLERNKRALRAENHRLEEMLNISSLSPEIHAILNTGGEILYINDAVTTLLGYTIEEGRQKNFWEVCFADDQDRVRKLVETGQNTDQKQFDIQFRLVGKTGCVRWFSWSMVTKNGRW